MKAPFRFLLIGLALALTTTWASPPRVALPPVAQIDTSDGPHVLWNGTAAIIYRVRDGQVAQDTVTGVFEAMLPGLSDRPIRLSPERPNVVQSSFPRPEKILAVSDIHGRFDTLQTLLKAQKVVGEDLRWRFGKGHLVVVGDVMDRGPQVTEAYWFLRGLEQEAKAAGGAVHVLLGNHEAMLLAGDLRYVNPKYLKTLKGLPPLAELYGPNAELGRWLRSRPVLVRLGEVLFVHGGLSPDVLALGMSLDQINAKIQQNLGLKPKEATGDVAILLGSSGPLWYRGLLPEGGGPQASEEHITAVLNHFQARIIVVGHTTMHTLGAFHGGRVFGIDAGIKDGSAGEAWFWEHGRAWKATADGAREPL